MTGTPTARYVIAGWRITSSTQTIVSVQNIVGGVVSASLAWTSGGLRERFGCRQMIIYTGMLAICEPFTYAAFPGVFLLVFFWRFLWDPAVAGLRESVV